MANARSAIEWTDRTWNPTTGCNKVSPGCKFCYAETITKRFSTTFPNGFKFTLNPERLRQPLAWRQPSLIFVNSMSDLFHEEMPLDYLQQIFRIMAEADWHVFQVLTKRHERLLQLAPKLDWPPNVWMGVSVENQKYTKRIDYLRQVPAHVRFLSCEPLLGPLNLNLDGIHWVITGGESGPKHRPIEVDWVRSIRDQCSAVGVAYFHKQWGGRTPKSNGRELDGQLHDAMPAY
ncbi:MAG TPA: phage Gp37/Gp68 family protein [Trueperaceae bacterium]|nr:phage Gp37/Gp68 family protein [Trueperaceae bacterium]